MLNVKKTLTKLMTKDKLIFFANSPSMGNSPLLSDTISNYDVLDIYLVDNDGNDGFVSVLTSANGFIATITKGSAGNNEVYIKSALYLIDNANAQLKCNTGRRIQGFFSGNSQSVANISCIAIKAVVGRKLGGGVIRTLKKAISNLYREGVAVC